MSSSRYDVYGAALTDVYFDAASYTGRLASSKPLDAELVAHIGTASERCPSPSYVPPGSPPHADPGLRLRDMVGPEGESVLRYHESNEPVRGGLLERSEGARRTVWIGSLERTVASEHAVRAVMRQAGHVACVHLVKQPERSQKKSWALVVFREMAAAEMAASTDSGPLPGAQNWRVAMVKPERVPGKQLTIALEGWRENKNSSHARRQSLGQVESADYQTQRIGLVTAPVPASPRPGAVGLSSPSRALVQDMTRHPGGAVGSRGSMGFAETNEFATPSKQRPSFANSGSPRGFFGIATPGSVHNTPRGLSIGSRFGAQLDQDGGTADANASTTRAMLVAGDEAEFEPLTEAEPKQLISYRQPAPALFRLAYRALNRLPALPPPEPPPENSSRASPRVKPPKKPLKVHDVGTDPAESLASCMDNPSKQLHLAMATVCGLLKLPADDWAMEELVRSGGLVPALHSLDVRSLQGPIVRTLGQTIVELIEHGHASPSSSQQRLESVIARNDRQPSPLHALCVWLYAVWLTANPEDTLNKRQAAMWGCMQLPAEMRSSDQRMEQAVAWAKTTDLLRHVPDAQLREIMEHSDVIRLRPGQTVLRPGSQVCVISLVLAGTVTAVLTEIDASAVAASNACVTLKGWEKKQQLGTIVRYKPAAMFGSLGDTVVDSDGEVAHRHHEEWHRAVAEKETKNVGQQSLKATKLQAATKSLDVRVPLVLGPGATIGRDKAVLECRRIQETQHEDGDRAVAAKRQWPHVANTVVRCATPTVMLEFSRPEDVVAIGLANELELKGKFTGLFRFDELRGCSSTTIRELAKFSERRSVRKGELLFEAGDGIDEHIFVLSGALQITKPRTDGAVNHVATVGAGSVFGEYPEVHVCRAATVRVTGDEPCEVLAVHVHNLQHVLAKVDGCAFADTADIAMSVLTAAAAAAAAK